MSALYTVGKWAGLPNYQCSLCSFATLSEAEILAHWAERHAAKTVPLTSEHILIADKGGRVVSEPVPGSQQKGEPIELELTLEERAALGEIEARKRNKRKEA